MLAPEILNKIFSNLSYSEVYRIRSVCKLWRQLCEYHLYLSFKSNKQKIYVKIGEKGRTGLIDMEPFRYHPESQVIEFKVSSLDEDQDIFMDIKNSSRRMQILFSEWYERATFNSNLIQSLSLQERANVLFHLKYNPSLEQVYEIPTPTDKTDHYVGDKGVIMSFSYINLDDDTDQPVVDRALEFRGIEDPDITSSFQTLFDEVLVNRPVNKQVVRLRINTIHANLSWLMSGINPDITPQPIYVHRYEKLAKVLGSAGIHSNVCAYSEPVLKYIMHGTCTSILDMTELGGYSRREQLRFKLQSIGIDPRAIWKYNLAKNFILKNENQRDIEDVARVIQKSEEEWIIKKLDLVRQLRK